MRTPTPSEQLKVLHISNYYPPHIGGIEQIARDVIHSLPNHKHEIICFNDTNSTEQEYIEGTKITRCATIAKFASQAISTSFATTLKNTLKAFSPDIIHIHLPNPFMATLAHALMPQTAKLILHWHSDIIKQKFVYPIYKSIERKLLQRADLVIATSPNYASGSEPLKDFQNKIAIVPNSINPARLYTKTVLSHEIATIKSKYGNNKIIFFCGRHVPYKGLKHLINCAKLLEETKDATFVIAGSGPLTARLKRQAANSSNVEFIGNIDDKTLSAFLYCSHIFAFPSVTRNEAFGVSLAEALFCGLPAVTFDIKGSGVPWVNKDDHTGFVVTNKDEFEFASKIKTLIACPHMRTQFSENAKTWANTQYGPNIFSQKIREVYSRI